MDIASPEFPWTPLSGWSQEQYFQQGPSDVSLHPDAGLGPNWDIKKRTRQGTLFFGGQGDTSSLISVGFCLVPSIKQGPYSRSDVHRRVSPGTLEEGFLGTVDSRWGPSMNNRESSGRASPNKVLTTVSLVVFRAKPLA